MLFFTLWFCFFFFLGRLFLHCNPPEPLPATHTEPIARMARERRRARRRPAEIRDLKVTFPGGEGAAFLGGVGMMMVMVMVVGVMIDRG